MKKYTNGIILSLLLTAAAGAQGFDHSEFQKFLDKYVDEKGMVDYSGAAGDQHLENYMEELAEADVSRFGKADKIAFYLNAYNASAIKNVIDNYPISSPMDVKNFFKEKKFTIAGEKLSLDVIEHKKLLPFDPLLPHFGLVCVSMSCPRLRENVYRGDNVTTALQDNAKLFLRNSSKNYLDRDANTLYLSQIFQWFRNNFEERYGSLMKTAAVFMNSSDASFIRSNNPNVKFLEYDWSLNKQ